VGRVRYIFYVGRSGKDCGKRVKRRWENPSELKGGWFFTEGVGEGFQRQSAKKGKTGIRKRSDREWNRKGGEMRKKRTSLEVGKH